MGSIFVVHLLCLNNFYYQADFVVREDDQIAEELKKTYMDLKEQVEYLSRRIKNSFNSCCPKPHLLFSGRYAKIKKGCLH